MIISFFLGNMFCLFGLAWKLTYSRRNYTSGFSLLSGEFNKKKEVQSKKVESDADIALTH
jgi:hypothetical protein